MIPLLPNTHGKPDDWFPRFPPLQAAHSGSTGPTFFLCITWARRRNWFSMVCISDWLTFHASSLSCCSFFYLLPPNSFSLPNNFSVHVVGGISVFLPMYFLLWLFHQCVFFSCFPRFRFKGPCFFPAAKTHTEKWCKTYDTVKFFW